MDRFSRTSGQFKQTKRSSFFTHIYSFCAKAKTEMLQELHGRLSNPACGGTYTNNGANSPEDEQIKQMLDTCIEMKAKTAISNLQKSYSQMKSSSKPRYADRLLEYVNKCVEICWLMNTQSLSLIFAEPLPSGQTIDKDQYKEYTRQGDVVSFIVWLPLLIEQDGVVLSKGVVQPVQRSKAKSERRRSLKSQSAAYRGVYSPSVPAHMTSKNDYSDETTSRWTQRPTYGYTSHRKKAADYSNQRSQTVGVPLPESDKNTTLQIDPSEIFAVGGYNYTLHKGILYKQDHTGEWHFSNELGDS